MSDGSSTGSGTDSLTIWQSGSLAVWQPGSPNVPSYLALVVWSRSRLGVTWAFIYLGAYIPSRQVFI